MKNTLQAVSNHKYSNILEGFGKSDITYNLKFRFNGANYKNNWQI